MQVESVTNQAEIYRPCASFPGLTTHMENPLVGFFLDDLFNSVENTMDSIISNAGQVAKELELELGNQVNLAIQNAKNAYKDCLELTMDKVNESVAKNLSELNSLVEAFQKRNADTVKDVMDRVQMLINTLPFMNQQPRLRASAPKFIEAETPEEVLLEFQGNFPNMASDPLLKPKLVFNNKEIELVDQKELNLIFKSKAGAIFPADKKIEKFSYMVGKLVLPWDNTSNLSYVEQMKYWVQGKRDIKNNEYAVLEKAIPLSPGRITAWYTKQKEGNPIIQTKTTPDAHEDANHAYSKGHCGLQDHHSFTYYPDTGFQIIPGSAVLDVWNAHGNHQERITYVGPERVDVEIAMDRCSGKHMGIIDFHVRFNQIKQTTITEDSSQEVSLKWRESAVLPINDPVKGRLVRIDFYGFDGINNQFGPVTDISSSRYIKVMSQGANIQISAQIPPDFAISKV